MKTLDIRKVNFSFEVEPEDTYVGDALSKEQTGADHSEYIKRVNKGLDSNPWLWCVIKVTATYKGFEGVDYLSGCCFEGEDDFRFGGTYDSMKEEAFNDLQNVIEAAIEDLKELI